MVQMFKGNLLMAARDSRAGGEEGGKMPVMSISSAKWIEKSSLKNVLMEDKVKSGLN